MKLLNFKEKYDILRFLVKITPFIVVPVLTGLSLWLNCSISRDRESGKRIRTSKALLIGGTIGFVATAVASALGSKFFSRKENSFLDIAIEYIFQNQANRVDLIAEYLPKTIIFIPLAITSLYCSRFDNHLMALGESLVFAGIVTYGQKFICQKVLGFIGKFLKEKLEKKVVESASEKIVKFYDYVKNTKTFQAICTMPF